MLNITSTTNPEEILYIAHKATAVPSLIILYISGALIFLLIGLLLIDRKRSGYSKFLWIYFISILLIGIIVLFLAFSPNTIQKIVELFSFT